MNDLPMTRDRAQRLARWIKSNHGAAIEEKLDGTPFSLDIACGICRKETGIYLVDFIANMEAAEALARCVFDASGDADGTSRRAFPVNTEAFRTAYGDEFTAMLVDQANKTRAVRGLGARNREPVA